MTPMTRSTALLLVLAMAGCDEAASSGGAVRSGSEAPVAAAAQENLPSTGNDFKDANSYRLTMPKVRAFVRAQASLSEIEEREEDTVLDPGRDIAARAAALEKHASARAALAKEGLSPREFALIEVSLMGNAIAAWTPQGKQFAQSQGVSAENMAFVEANREELKKVLRLDEAAKDGAE